jgi:hypothetical protein
MSLPKPSDEQVLILNSIELNNNNIVIDAVAGSGKTTTILWIANTFTNKKIIQITYNSQLKIEVRDKAKTMELNNLEVHSYHSLAVKYYLKEAHTDQVLSNIISNDIDIASKVLYDILIIDEVQDMTPLYYTFINKFIKDSVKLNTIKLIFMGDKHQCIYKFKSADNRFLTLAHEIWDNKLSSDLSDVSESTFTELYLNTSYRVTYEIAEFVNLNMLGKKRLIAKKHGPKVEYIKCRPYSIFKIITKKIIEGKYKPSDIFVLCPSIKAKTPCRLLENELVSNGYPCYVPLSEESNLNNSIIEGKVVFTTFHQAKGRERPLVIIYGFDKSYFDYFARDENPNECPNTLYVAVTRASKHLILVADENNDPLPFIKTLSPAWHLNSTGSMYSTKSHNISKSKGGGGSGSGNGSGSSYIKSTKENIVHSSSVTNLVKFIKDHYLNELGLIINKLWDLTHADTMDLNLPCTCNKEEVSDLNGLAIPALYQYIKNKNNYFEEYINNYINLSTTGASNKLIKSELIKAKSNSTDIGKFLHMANIYQACSSGMHFKITQIKDYNWLETPVVNDCIKNMDKYMKNVSNYELPIHCSFDGDYGTININGIIDAYNSTDKTIWELKCVNDLTIEHFLQASVYYYIKLISNLNTDPWNGKCILFNIRTCEMYSMNNNPELLQLLIDILVKNKYDTEISLSDKDFIKKCKDIKLQSNKSIMSISSSNVLSDLNANSDDEDSFKLNKCLI